MARKTPNRQQLRREVEAAEAAEAQEASAPKKKKATRKKAATRKKRTKVKAVERRRLIWAIYSGNMKEEARFPYAERKEAEEKLEQLKVKGKKKSYFIQPLKEIITEPLPVEEE